ncbi:MAG: hypothetical protein ACFB0B_19025 [Thermonemataceae bacterium]
MKDIVSERAATILDLLEQIEATNQMVTLHKEDTFMRDQYLYRKEVLIKEFVQQLKAFNISPDDLAA